MNPTVKDIMTTDVIWVSKQASFREMAAALREHRVSAFPVLDDAMKVIGVVSEADMLAKEALGLEPAGKVTGILHHKEQQKARGVMAGELMTAPAVTVSPDDTVQHAARLMHTHRVKRLPVTDADGYLVGIISRADVLSVFDRADEEIRNDITNDVMTHQFLVDPKGYGVVVRDGIVTLSGVPESATVGRDMVQRIRHVPGVVAVRDRLFYPPPQRDRDGFDVLANFPPD
jgi:predicted transcriptional regulator